MGGRQSRRELAQLGRVVRALQEAIAMAAVLSRVSGKRMSAGAWCEGQERSRWLGPSRKAVDRERMRSLSSLLYEGRPAMFSVCEIALQSPTLQTRP